jgi:hypothetical protein
MSGASQSYANNGSHGSYRWLTASNHDLDSLIGRCPTAFLECYVAVTSYDSGIYSLDDAEKTAGWETRGSIAYSPMIRSPEMLPARGGYDEWYLFGSPIDLGRLSERRNIFESPLRSRVVEVFVNFGQGLRLDTPNDALTGLFWRQLEGIRPELYVADNASFLICVSANEDLFAKISQSLA